MRSVDTNIVKIDKKFILRYLSEEQIFEKYLGHIVDEDEFYVNPLRRDNNPDCKYYYGNNTGRLWFIDFASKEHYDCFNVVEKLYRCNYFRACEIIAMDFGLLNVGAKPVQQYFIPDQEKKERVKVTLRVKSKKYFTKGHLDFWKQFSLPLTDAELVNELLVGGIRPIDTCFLERNGSFKVIYEYRKDRPAFVYNLSEDDYSYEFYFPYQSKGQPKHIHSTNATLHYLHNLPPVGDLLVVTKSRKDAWLLRQFGIQSVGVLTERKLVDESIMEDLLSRFTNVVTLFDNDRTGISLSCRMRRKYGTLTLTFPKDMGKDFSDVLLEIGYESMIDLIEETKTYYSL